MVQSAKTITKQQSIVFLKVRDVKLGNYVVIANDHTLVLGWNSAAVPLLRQMAMTKAQFPKPNALQRCASCLPASILRPVLLGVVHLGFVKCHLALWDSILA